MRRIGLIGYGAIGRRVCRLLAGQGGVRIVGVLLRAGSAARAVAEADGIAVVDGLAALLAREPDAVAECAGQAALAAHGPAVLEAGRLLVAASAGAFADPALEARLNAAAGAGGRLVLPAGAIGGIDALVAMRLAGLAAVRYTGRKPPMAWAGSPAEALVDLGALTEPAAFYRGTARQAARDYPRNANVAATLALAGLGFEGTEVVLIADPGVARNVHEIEAEGVTGRIAVRLEGLPDPENPRTSALTAASVAAVAAGRAGGLTLAP